MLTKTQQKFLLKLKENEIFADEQMFWCKKFFYVNISYLIRADLVKEKTIRGFGRPRKLYFLSEMGQELTKILSKIQEVRFR